MDREYSDMTCSTHTDNWSIVNYQKKEKKKKTVGGKMEKRGATVGHKNQTHSQDRK